MEQVTQLLEVFLFKTCSNFELLIKALDFIQNEIQINNFLLLDKFKQEKKDSLCSYILLNEIKYLMCYSQVILYFMKENVSCFQQLVMNTIVDTNKITNSTMMGSANLSLPKARMSVKKRMTIVQTSLRLGNQPILQGDQIPKNFWVCKLKRDYQIFALQSVLLAQHWSGISEIKNDIMMKGLFLDSQLKNLNIAISFKHMRSSKQNRQMDEDQKFKHSTEQKIGRGLNYL